MSVLPVEAIGIQGVQATSYLSTVEPVSDNDGFASVLAGAVDNVSALQSTSTALGVKAVTGDLADVHDYTVAATEAAVALELTAALRNRAVAAFQEIMRMQA
ncbi:flagellar hook-basal body complex protein FliE [Demequina sp.]|uniref:flagellar hook-basal body complex protein FliE n=1 Tax=Demequina sp. TaxID=2050685 RepID=UPI003A8B0A65